MAPPRVTRYQIGPPLASRPWGHGRPTRQGNHTRPAASDQIVWGVFPAARDGPPAGPAPAARPAAGPGLVAAVNGRHNTSLGPVTRSRFTYPRKDVRHGSVPADAVGPGPRPRPGRRAATDQRPQHLRRARR